MRDEHGNEVVMRCKKERIMLHPTTRERLWCSEHGRLNGGVKRDTSVYRQPTAGRPAAAGSSKKKGKIEEGDPLPEVPLPRLTASTLQLDRPRIVLQHPAGICNMLLSVQDLFEPRENKKNWKKDLDMTSDFPALAEKARLIGQALFSDFDDSQIITEQYCNLIRVKQNGVCGVTALKRHTHVHQHVMGVANHLLRGQKLWRFWPPWFRRDATRDHEADSELASDVAVEILQKAGDLLIFPPGWWHEVHTTGGEFPPRNTSGETIATHFVMWLMPQSVCAEALLAYASGSVDEDQEGSMKHCTPSVAKKLYAVYTKGQAASYRSGPPAPSSPPPSAPPSPPASPSPAFDLNSEGESSEIEGDEGEEGEEGEEGVIVDGCIPCYCAAGTCKRMVLIDWNTEHMCCHACEPLECEHLCMCQDCSCSSTVD